MRPLLPLVAAAVAGLAVALAACGTATPPAPPPRIPPLAASGQAATAGAAIAYPAPAQVDYRITGTLANVATHAVAYRLDGTTTTARVTELAGAFGLTNVQSDASGWTADDGTHTLRVQRSAGLPWTLSASGPVAVGGSGCAVASPGSTSGAAPGNAGEVSAAPATPGPSAPAAPVVTAPLAPPPTCPPPTTAPGLPTQAAAVQSARGVLAKAGIDLTDATLDASGGSSDWTITVTHALGGVPVVGNIATITIGPLGSFTFASGYLADAVAVGDYPLVGVPGGVQRLRDGGRWILFGGPGPVPMIAIANGAAAVGAPATAVAPSAPASGAVSPPASTVSGANASAPAPPPTAICDGATCTTSVTAPATCVAGAPCPTIPVAVRTIQAVHLGLAWAMPTDPTAAEAWLLPVYVFEFDGGMTMSVLAVSDGFLSVASETSTTPPSTPSPMPSVEPQPAPAVTPPSAVSPASR